VDCIKEVAVFPKSQDEDSDATVEKTQPVSIPLKKGSQTADILVDHFIERCLKLKLEMEAVMVPGKCTEGKASD
jgi:hypothetical protein